MTVINDGDLISTMLASLTKHYYLKCNLWDSDMLISNVTKEILEILEMVASQWTSSQYNLHHTI